jgi:flagellum-specific ATP synthase
MKNLVLLKDFIDDYNYLPWNGTVDRISGYVVESIGPKVSIGEIVYIDSGKSQIPCLVIGFASNKVYLTPFDAVEGIEPGSIVKKTGKQLGLWVGKHLLGHVLDGLGRPLSVEHIARDDKSQYRSIENKSPHPLTRGRIREPISTGIRAIDGLLTLGKGQRMGIFAGSGIGKTTLLGMISRFCDAQVNIIALVGERGREVREFLEESLGEDGLAKSVVIVSTSDNPPSQRVLSAFTATVIAEYFRDLGMDVLMVMDSLTRVCMAQRELGLSIGEPPTTRGYPPSVFTMMARLLERAGTSDKGSITGIYTVLVEGDDLSEPIADHARSILDGHIVLSRDLAERGHYPPIDISQSISRLMSSIAKKDHLNLSYRIKELIASYKEAYDLINIGAYQKGSNPKIDESIEKISRIEEFLKQDPYDTSSFDDTYKKLSEILQ